MLFFKQSVETFEVVEELFYEPSGSGEHLFARIRKKGVSTPIAKKRISEVTGVKERWMGHAGQKDTQATAEQWLSWPAAQQKNEFTGRPDLMILELVRHPNKLAIGHVKYNHFRLTFEGDGPFPSAEQLAEPFPNFYGRQRFGRSVGQSIAALLASTEGSRDAISVLQSAMFNAYLTQRLAEVKLTYQDEELWTATNGKRWFAAPFDEELQGRLARGEIAATGPIYGYKVSLRGDEERFLKELQVPENLFRRWGKSAKGARRPLLVTPIVKGLELGEGQATLSFALPSGAYATSYLLALFQPGYWHTPIESWPDFTQGVQLV